MRTIAIRVKDGIRSPWNVACTYCLTYRRSPWRRWALIKLYWSHKPDCQWRYGPIRTRLWHG